MISYRDKTKYKVKLLNKSIKKEYKIWILRDSDYVYDWLWHSRIDEPEEISEKDMEVERISSKEESTKIFLTSTFVLVIRLIQRLRQVYKLRIFYLFLNNLFLNVNVI